MSVPAKRLSALLATGLIAASFAGIAAGVAAEPAGSQSVLQAVAARQADPEAGSGRYPLSQAQGRRVMVVTAHPLATAAALDMLRAGGSAADAAVAAQAVLGLVEPQSSGLGGGGFLVMAVPGQGVTAVDGRETAPAATDEHRFQHADGSPMAFDEALGQARAVGVPGTVALLAETHRRWGRLPWARTLQPAIRLAERGVPVSHRLNLLAGQDALLHASPSLRAHFLDADGQPWPVGHALRNPAQARLLRALARQGPQAFYHGPMAATFVDGLRAAGSDITLADWSQYRARVSPALCRPLGEQTLCSAPPPAGGLTVLENIGLRQASPAIAPDDDNSRLHRLLEAERLGFADRQRYAADPAQTAVPVDGLLAADYLAARASLISAQAASGSVAAGTPAGAPLVARDAQLREAGTSHLAIVDADGRWLAMTSSIEDSFGSRLMLQGILMNNQLTDFSFLPVQDGKPVANRVAPGKRPRSAMSPTLVLDARGRPLLSLGSPGGSRIIGFNTRVLSAWLDGLRDAGALVSLPHALNRNGASEIEATLPADTVASLRQRGHDLRVAPMTSGLGVILRRPDGGLDGAADPRREGRAAGW